MFILAFTKTLLSALAHNALHYTIALTLTNIELINAKISYIYINVYLVIF